MLLLCTTLPLVPLGVVPLTLRLPLPPHPQVLCDGLEEDMVTRRLMLHEAAGLPAGGSAGALSPELEIMVRSSGKMLLLHKLLPKLRAEV